MHEIAIRLSKRLRGVVRVPDFAPTPVLARPPAPDVALLEQARADRRFIESALASLRGAVADVEQRRQAHTADWQAAAIELALTIAARLFHEEVDAGRFPLEALVRDMVAPLAGSPALRVFLNPADLRVLHDRLGGRPLLGDDTAVRLSTDPTLARGDCRVEDGDQVLVAQLSEQLRAVRDELLGSVAHGPA